jgi:hypothetical protein
MFIDRGIFKQKTDVMDAAMDLLVKRQMEIDSAIQAEEYLKNESLFKMQTEVNQELAKQKRNK